MSALNWIVGASSGIGEALAEALAEAGESVAVSARRAERLQALANKYPKIHAYPLDVLVPGALQATAARIEAELGPLTRVFLNVGTYEPASLTPVDPARFARLMATNYQSVIEGVAAVLPFMLQRGRGELLITGSVAGYRGLPNAASYGATKAALIHFAECARLELEPLGVKVRIINPGFVKTPLTDKNRFPMPGLMSAEAAAQRIVKALPDQQFEIAFPRRLVWPMKILKRLPSVVYFPLIRRLTGVAQ